MEALCRRLVCLLTLVVGDIHIDWYGKIAKVLADQRPDRSPLQATHTRGKPRQGKAFHLALVEFMPQASQAVIDV